jgi:hypothetical protein
MSDDAPVLTPRSTFRTEPAPLPLHYQSGSLP